MTNYIAWISLDNKKIACGELEQLLRIKVDNTSTVDKVYADPEDRIVTFSYDGDERRFQQLACTQRICKVIEHFSIDAPPKKLKVQIDTPSYKVEFLNSLLDVDKTTATKCYKLIWESMKKPKVDVKNPQTIFYCHINLKTNEVTVAQQVWANDYAYEKRKSHLREKTHSAVMHPKLVRTMVNLTGFVPFVDTEKSEQHITLLDPFCGTGGFLIEAMHCGFAVKGSDNDPKMTSGVKINIKNEIKTHKEFKKLCDPAKDIQKVSALDIDTKADVIVTDVPYAKNTKKLTTPTLYRDFLNHAHSNNLAKRIVICMPNYGNGEKVIEQTKWKLIDVYKLPVHNSLTREIYILSR